MLYPRTDWEDCADCLCAICVRNADNDMSSESLGEVLSPCHCGGIERCGVVEFEEDCIGEGFVPDDMDKDEVKIMVLTIEYINGDIETIYPDDVTEKESCLHYYIRFGVDSGSYYIPYSQIKRCKIEG